MTKVAFGNSIERNNMCIEEAAKIGHSYREVLRLLEKSECGENISWLKNELKKNNIEIENYDIPEKIEYSYEEMFCENSLVDRKRIKTYIKNNNLKEYKCECCGCDGNWQGGLISLQLHHINGIKDDNRIENLQLLCPNCHALTDTYCGKNKKGI